MNPYQAPEIPTQGDSQPPGRVRILEAMSRTQLIFQLVIFPLVIYFYVGSSDDRNLSEPRHLWSIIAAVELFALGSWTYWRMRENPLRVSPPTHQGKPALWAGSAWHRRNLLYASNGYLFLTWDSLVWVKRLGDEHCERVVIPLDQVAIARATRSRLTLQGLDGVRTRFRVHGAKEWKEVMKIIHDARLRHAPEPGTSRPAPAPLAAS